MNNGNSVRGCVFGGGMRSAGIAGGCPLTCAGMARAGTVAEERDVLVFVAGNEDEVDEFGDIGTGDFGRKHAGNVKNVVGIENDGHEIVQEGYLAGLAEAGKIEFNAGLERSAHRIQNPGARSSEHLTHD